MNNTVMLIGRIGNKPELTTFPSGKKRVRFSLAVKEFAPDDAEAQTLWVTVEAWNGVAERAAATITKGREVAVNGRLALGSMDTKEKHGQSIEVQRPIVKLAGFHHCGPKPKTDEPASQDQPQAPRRGSRKIA